MKCGYWSISFCCSCSWIFFFWNLVSFTFQSVSNSISSMRIMWVLTFTLHSNYDCGSNSYAPYICSLPAEWQWNDYKLTKIAIETDRYCYPTSKNILCQSFIPIIFLNIIRLSQMSSNWRGVHLRVCYVLLASRAISGIRENTYLVIPAYALNE